jgi:tetratricopeptide (TPR) repeat protein
MNLKKITLVTLLIILFSSCAPYSLPEKEPVVQRDNAFTFYSLALEQFKAQEYELAITSLNRAIQINPNFFQFHQLAGDIHAARADYDAALRAYNLALTQRSNSPDIYQRMAAIREMQKRYPEAINLHRRALTSGSGDDEVYLNIAADYLLIEETGPALGALQDYQRVVAGRDGQLSERYYLLHADVLQRRKNFTAALIELENISQPDSTGREKQSVVSDARPLFLSEKRLGGCRTAFSPGHQSERAKCRRALLPG